MSFAAMMEGMRRAAITVESFAAAVNTSLPEVKFLTEYAAEPIPDPIRDDCRYFVLLGGGRRDLLRQVDPDGFAVTINPATGDKFLSIWSGAKIITWAEQGRTFAELTHEQARDHLAGIRVGGILGGLSL